ncbi:MarR family winged helix-turn-helix transcriptional regulator [Gryllotalpicola reticulitermitis]|uniref:MarR family winged helix-turn-helix transcriptional regulator n=1 Tax=Gryllotalpicola reticulitermitis TaxID=1184153 RepID=A0ABV8Q879_9MICO
MRDEARSVAAWEALFRAQVAVMRRLGADFPRNDISFNEYDVMFTLTRAANRALRLRDLTRAVLLTQPSVSRLVDRLAARGLVDKLPDETDARGTVIRLTDAGRDAFHAVARVHGASIDRIVGDALSPDELEQLTRLTTKLRANLPPA